MESKDGNQVAVTVFLACFQSLEVMKEYRDMGFEKHLSVASKYIKFICHNLSFETLDLYNTRIKEVEASVKDVSSKLASGLK